MSLISGGGILGNVAALKAITGQVTAHTHAISEVTDLQTTLNTMQLTLAKFPAITVSALPTENVVVGATYRLTTADAAFLAPPGYYLAIPMGTTCWICLQADCEYVLPNAAGVYTPGVLIPGVDYKVTLTDAVTTFNLSMAPGVVILYKYGAFALPMPTLTDGTNYSLYENSWADAELDGVKCLISRKVDTEGVSLVTCSASQMIAPAV